MNLVDPGLTGVVGNGSGYCLVEVGKGRVLWVQGASRVAFSD